MGNFRESFQKAADKTRMGLINGIAIAPYIVFWSMGGPAATVAGAAFLGGAIISFLAHGATEPTMAQTRLKAGKFRKTAEGDAYQARLDRTLEQFNALKSEMGQDQAVLRLGREAMATPGDIILIGRHEVENYTADEMEFVLAHELSHVKHKDNTKFLTVASVVAGFAMLPMQIGAAIFTPVSLLAVGMAAANIGVQIWAKSMSSQVIEDRADRTALSVTNNLKAAESWMEKALSDDIEKSPAKQWLKQLVHHHSVGDIRINRAQRSAKKLGLKPT